MRQNPNYIRRTLNEIKSLSNRLKEAYVYKDDMDMTFENVTERIDDAIRYLEHALYDIRNR